MSVWLNTRGFTSLAVAICDRCKMKRPISALGSDPNSPGIFACLNGCIDEYDPWRLPARYAEEITLDHPRPDLPLVFSSAGGYLLLESGDKILFGSASGYILLQR